MKYIATFYSHFGAIRFKKNLEALSIKAMLMPVPRNLSSSCGTCVAFDICKGDESATVEEILNNCQEHLDEIEQLVQENETGYEIIFVAKDS